MEIIKVKNYHELSKIAAETIIKKVNQSSKFTLGLATGSTPEGLYRYLVEDRSLHHTNYQHVKAFNLDEYVGMNPENEQSYYYYMNHHLFNHINILPDNIHLPLGNKENLEYECEHYELLIEQNGGIDIQVLGIGQNGHIGFNEPGTSFKSSTHVVELDDSTRKANSRFFHTIDEVPTHAITMGISTILKSKEILLLVSGKCKARALQRLLDGEISEEFPASILKNHSNITVIADLDAQGA
ncbi:glucosamine-6-phosphate deaminase [Bacillus sp. FJAT-27986]|uniref:glucosamine-6-phosphate deaminase n=1 Tax=Bacillus sp. FJAT-27986 TaxID=1743146 RepID=UPI00080ACB91|nr:glucosamine-6-phosphate deaminase [Bacillus sp. FJAT-27986]OCA86770.1 glucosamine-6-phosphate deaminase [Bacillus sp. FJAT-27986]